MLVWLAFAIVSAAVIAAMIRPLTRGRALAPARASFDRRVYRDQLLEVERDHGRGLLSEAEAAAARLEVERRLLATASSERRQASPGVGGDRTAPMLAVALALLVSAGAIAVYMVNGAPLAPDQPYAARAAERSLVGANGSLDLDKTVATLKARLASDPGDAEGWLLLARTEAAQGRWQESASAFHQALALTQQRGDVAAAYGEMLVLAADGMVTSAARDAFVMALTKDPKTPTARFYLALADAQAGNAQAALDAWQKLLADTPADAPWVPMLKQHMADTAKAAGLSVPPPPESATASPGPSADDLAAAAQMTREQRASMARAMVERLAQRLASAPDDLPGWLRLGRAETVLGDTDKAADAFAHAAALKPDDPVILAQEVDALMAGRAPTDAIPEATRAVLRKLEALDASDPRALWYLGLAAAQDHHVDEAKSYWQRLLSVLPADSEEHKMVTTALDALAGK